VRIEIHHAWRKKESPTTRHKGNRAFLQVKAKGGISKREGAGSRVAQRKKKKGLVHPGKTGMRLLYHKLEVIIVGRKRKTVAESSGKENEGRRHRHMKGGSLFFTKGQWRMVG